MADNGRVSFGGNLFVAGGMPFSASGGDKGLSNATLNSEANELTCSNAANFWPYLTMNSGSLKRISLTIAINFASDMIGPGEEDSGDNL